LVKPKIQDGLFLFCGIVGACILLSGLFYGPAQLYYVLGSILLLFTALHFKLTYFMALELILISGHGAILLEFSNHLQIALPILLSVQLLFFYLLSGQLSNVFLVVGISGIALLSIGFAYANQWVFFLGSISIAIYAFYTAYQGKPITLLWAILNTLFALTAVVKLIFY
jgi:hypothetical protein